MPKGILLRSHYISFRRHNKNLVSLPVYLSPWIVVKPWNFIIFIKIILLSVCPHKETRSIIKSNFLHCNYFNHIDINNKVVNTINRLGWNEKTKIFDVTKVQLNIYYLNYFISKFFFIINPLFFWSYYYYLYSYTLYIHNYYTV